MVEFNPRDKGNKPGIAIMIAVKKPKKGEKVKKAYSGRRPDWNNISSQPDGEEIALPTTTLDARLSTRNPASSGTGANENGLMTHSRRGPDITGGMPTEEFQNWQERIAAQLRQQQRLAQRIPGGIPSATQPERVNRRNFHVDSKFNSDGNVKEGWPQKNTQIAGKIGPPRLAGALGVGPTKWQTVEGVDNTVLTGEPMAIAWQLLKEAGMDGLDEDGNYPEKPPNVPQYAFKVNAAPTGGFKLSDWMRNYRPKPPADPEKKARDLANRGFTPQWIKNQKQANAENAAAMRRDDHQPIGG